MSSEHAWPVAMNLLDQMSRPRLPDQKWGVDISYIWTREGWLYLSIVLDLFFPPRCRLDHQRSSASGPGSVGPQESPDHAPAGLIHHSDRGSQYCAVDYQGELRKNGIRISMSGKGNCYDNATVETFFKTIKSELVWRTSLDTRQDAEQAIARYIEGFYNPVRRHSRLRKPGSVRKPSPEMS